MTRVILAYKNFAANKCISHIGLGVAAINTAKVLNANGYRAEVWPIRDGNELRIRLNLAKGDGHPVTHVVISAPWIPTAGIAQLCTFFPTVKFAVNCHSNVGFLQADTNGVRLLREYLNYEMTCANFRVSANARKMSLWVHDAYGQPCLTLPNLYYLDDTTAHRHKRVIRDTGSHMRVGIFGAVRPQKNFVSAVAAAIELSYQLSNNTEIWISTGRLEGGGQTVLNAAMELCRNVPLVTVKEAGWQTWPQFRQLVGSMNILLQPSYTESFNMVTADGIAEGVPSVVTEAIYWVPRYWMANGDDVFDIARVARHLLTDPFARWDGYNALLGYNQDGLSLWQGFLV